MCQPWCSRVVPAAFVPKAFARQLQHKEHTGDLQIVVVQLPARPICEAAPALGGLGLTLGGGLIARSTSCLCREHKMPAGLSLS